MSQLEKAIKNLGLVRLIRTKERDIRLVILLRMDDWKHLVAPWWKGKSASIVAVDIDGDFVLCKSNGDFVVWDHKLGKELFLANNLSGLLSKLELDETNVP